jgi:hypothetical protein
MSLFSSGSQSGQQEEGFNSIRVIDVPDEPTGRGEFIQFVRSNPLLGACTDSNVTQEKN